MSNLRQNPIPSALQELPEDGRRTRSDCIIRIFRFFFAPRDPVNCSRHSKPIRPRIARSPYFRERPRRCKRPRRSVSGGPGVGWGGTPRHPGTARTDGTVRATATRICFTAPPASRERIAVASARSGRSRGRLPSVLREPSGSRSPSLHRRLSAAQS